MTGEVEKTLQSKLEGAHRRDYLHAQRAQLAPRLADPPAQATEDTPMDDAPPSMDAPTAATDAGPAPDTTMGDAADGVHHVPPNEQVDAAELAALRRLAAAIADESFGDPMDVDSPQPPQDTQARPDAAPPRGQPHPSAPDERDRDAHQAAPPAAAELPRPAASEDDTTGPAERGSTATDPRPPTRIKVVPSGAKRSAPDPPRGRSMSKKSKVEKEEEGQSPRARPRRRTRSQKNEGAGTQ